MLNSFGRPIFFIPIRKDYPLIGVLKLFRTLVAFIPPAFNQEGLPAYWGIETVIVDVVGLAGFREVHQEGLPAYWGIETDLARLEVDHVTEESGRTTRLLGY